MTMSARTFCLGFIGAVAVIVAAIVAANVVIDPEEMFQTNLLAAHSSPNTRYQKFRAYQRDADGVDGLFFASSRGGVFDTQSIATLAGAQRFASFSVIAGAITDPRRETKEITYKLTGAWGQLFNDVLAYARELVERSEGQALREQRMNWWAALALLRCISSSPAAAVNALRTRLQGAMGEECETDATSLEEFETQASDRVLDGTDDALSTDDIDKLRADGAL